MCSSIDFDIEQILAAPLSPNAFDTSIHDPAFQQIYDFLRDHSNTTFDAIKICDSYTSPNFDAFDTISHPLVDDVLQSTTLNPDSTSSIGSAISQVDIPYDNSKSGKIQILSNPRMKFRPRTEEESKESSHYIRCEENMPFEYPTIFIPSEWNQQKNVIEVTLVDIQKNPHLYMLDNKECKTSTLVFKSNQQNSLYFHVTEQDLENKQKSFLIEYIKPKQYGNITEEAIRTRQLEQSMLRFTRFYQTSDGTYHPDLSSVEYSLIMIEVYGNSSIEDVFPSNAPIGGAS